MECDMKQATWMEKHFRTPEDARKTISVGTSVGGVIGLLLVLVGAVLTHF